MFKGDYGFLSAQRSPDFFYSFDMPRTKKQVGARGEVVEEYHHGVWFRFEPLSGLRTDEEQRPVWETVDCPGLKGSAGRPAGQAAGRLDVTAESERTGVPEEDIIRYFLGQTGNRRIDAMMSEKMGFEYALTDKFGNVCEYGDHVLTPDEKVTQASARDEPMDRWILDEGTYYWCKACDKRLPRRGIYGHRRSKAHQENAAMKEQDVAAA